MKYILDLDPKTKEVISTAASMMQRYTLAMFDKNTPLPSGEVLTLGAVELAIADITHVQLLMLDRKLDGAPIAVSTDTFECMLACISYYAYTIHRAFIDNDVTESDALCAIEMLNWVTEKLENAVLVD